MGDVVKKVLDFISPVHGNNTEARRAEKPSTETKQTPKETRPTVEQVKDLGSKTGKALKESGAE